MSESMLLSPIETMESQPLQEWRHSPFMHMTGIEVLENMEIDEKNSEERYKYLRNDILKPPFDEPTIISVMGTTGGGKGGFGMGIDRLLLEDLYLKNEADKMGITISVYTLPFSLYQQASLLERVRDTFPTFHNEEFSSPEYYRAISEMMWGDVEKYIIPRKDGCKKVAIVESSSNTSHPTDLTQRPVGVTGVDRGNSVIYTSAVDSRLRSRAMIHALEGDETVQAESIERRKRMRDSDDLSLVFQENITYLYTNKSGERIDIASLPEAQQRVFMNFLLGCMAPPEVMERHKEQIASMREELDIEKDDEGYFKQLKKDLGYVHNDRHFATVTNSHVPTVQKTVDMDYFLYSLPVQLYPELLGEITL